MVNLFLKIMLLIAFINPCFSTQPLLEEEEICCCGGRHYRQLPVTLEKVMEASSLAEESKLNIEEFFNPDSYEIYRENICGCIRSIVDKSRLAIPKLKDQILDCAKAIVDQSYPERDSVDTSEKMTGLVLTILVNKPASDIQEFHEFNSFTEKSSHIPPFLSEEFMLSLERVESTSRFLLENLNLIYSESSSGRNFISIGGQKYDSIFSKNSSDGKSYVKNGPIIRYRMFFERFSPKRRYVKACDRLHVLPCQHGIAYKK